MSTKKTPVGLDVIDDQYARPKVRSGRPCEMDRSASCHRLHRFTFHDLINKINGLAFVQYPPMIEVKPQIPHAHLEPWAVTSAKGRGAPSRRTGVRPHSGRSAPLVVLGREGLAEIGVSAELENGVDRRFGHRSSRCLTMARTPATTIATRAQGKTALVQPIRVAMIAGGSGKIRPSAPAAPSTRAHMIRPTTPRVSILWVIVMTPTVRSRSVSARAAWHDLRLSTPTLWGRLGTKRRHGGVTAASAKS